VKRWEYCQVLTDTRTTMEDSEYMNVLGADGWELVTLRELGGGITWVYRREISGQEWANRVFKVDEMRKLAAR
jgi:hypothetical protein